MEQIAAQNVLILLVTSFLFAKGQPVLSIPNPGNHGDTTVLECTQAGFLEANGFSWEKDTVLIYSNLGEATTSGKYSGSSTIGSFSLNILTTEKSDEGMYRCIYIVTGSNTKMLVFESKFSGANLVASSQDKQLVLQIKKIYPSNPTVAVTCDTKAIPGAYISTPNTAVSTLFDLEWTSTQTLDVGDHSCNINVITVSTVDFTTPITITEPTTTTDGLTAGEKAGIAVGVILLVALLVLIPVVICWKLKKACFARKNENGTNAVEAGDMKETKPLPPIKKTAEVRPQPIPTDQDDKSRSDSVVSKADINPKLDDATVQYRTPAHTNGPHTRGISATMDESNLLKKNKLDPINPAEPEPDQKKKKKKKKSKKTDEEYEDNE